jgi:hypothetical protein
MIWLIGTSFVLTIFIAGIDLTRSSKSRSFPPLVHSVVLYGLILFVGNTVAGLIAWPVAHSMLAPSSASDAGKRPASTGSANIGGATVVATDANDASNDPLKLPPEGYVAIAALIGVFGFHGIIKNVNVSIYGKGFLTLDDWISKARDNAVAATNTAQNATSD